MVSGLEKRKERRIKVEIPAAVTYQGARLAGHTDNISRLGAYIELESEIPVGAAIGIMLEIPRYTSAGPWHGQVHCSGSVFRVHHIEEAGSAGHYGTGIFFTAFQGEADKERLSRYINFLVERETEQVTRGAKEWRQKRQTLQKKKQAPQDTPCEPQTRNKTLALLEEIKDKLEQLYRLLKPPA